MDVADALSDELMANGALSVEVSDADAGHEWEKPIFDELGGAPAPKWAHSRVSALYAIDADIDSSMRASLEAAGAARETAFELDRIDDEDWVRKTQSQFEPQQITPRLWIVPTWHRTPDPSAVNIMLDPGLAFGTGTHATTRLCLRWLGERIRGGESVLDVGCGSGILAIAAMKLGASRACGVDIDPEAIREARRNAEQNRVVATFVEATDAVDESGQLVLANILARPLIVLAPLLAKLTVSGGLLALSGILSEQASEVSDAYSAWYDFEPVEEESGWVLLSGTRR